MTGVASISIHHNSYSEVVKEQSMTHSYRRRSSLVEPFGRLHHPRRVYKYREYVTMRPTVQPGQVFVFSSQVPSRVSTGARGGGRKPGLCTQMSCHRAVVKLVGNSGEITRMQEEGGGVRSATTQPSLSGTQGPRSPEPCKGGGPSSPMHSGKCAKRGQSIEKQAV